VFALRIGVEMPVMKKPRLQIADEREEWASLQRLGVKVEVGRAIDW